MPAWLVYTIIGVFFAAVLAFAIWMIVRIAKMTPEKRRETIITFLMGLVSVAEQTFTGEGRGVEKLEWVEQEFNKTAPWFLKMLLLLTNTDSLEDLIEEALKRAKQAFNNS